MKMTFENLVKTGAEIICNSATSDAGKTNNCERWWGPRVGSVRVPNATFRKVVKECIYEVRGGWEGGKLISTITQIKIIGRK
jgi:hypothetical protein